MKPLTLEIAGLNSFRRKQVIEFGELLEDGLFGIFGPTGSGKSSILDAITLALYGRVKRAAGGKGGIINVREKSCSVRFTFEIDCDGSRRTYSIERVLGRSSGKSDGVVTKRARLIEHVGGAETPIAEKQSEIDGEILALLGIEYDEFMRAVVLPQGAFADFLGLKPKERAGVLQRLFGLQELGIRLSSRLRSQSEEMRTTRAGIEGRLAELRAYDDEAVAVAEAHLTEAAAAEERARASRSEADAALEAAEALWALLAERDELRTRAARNDEVRQQIAERRLRLERAERAAAIGTAVDALERAALRARDSEAVHAGSLVAQREADARLAGARDRFALADGAYQAGYDRICEEIARLDAAARELREIERQTAEAAARERERLELRAALEKSESARQELRSQIDASSTSVAANETRLGNVEVAREEHDRLSALLVVTERLRERERQHAERVRAINLFAEQLEHVAASIVETCTAEERAAAEERIANEQLLKSRAAAERHRAGRTKLESDYVQLRGVLRMVEQLEAQYRRQELECDQTRRSVEQRQSDWRVFENKFNGISERKQNLEVERLEAQERLQLAYRRFAVATLEPQLKDGAPCPLCGSLEHPQRAHDGMMGDDTELAECESTLRRVEGELAEAIARFTRCGQEWGELQTAIRHDSEQLKRAEEALAAVRGSICETLAAAGEELPLASSADLKEYLEDVKRRGIAERERLDAAEADVRRLEELIPSLTVAVAAHSRRAVELRTQQRSLAEQQLDARNAVTVLESEIVALRAEIAAGSGGRSPEEVEHDLERLRENDRAAQHLREVIANEQKKIAIIRAELESVEAASREQSDRHAATASLVVRITEEIEAHRAAFEERLAGVRSAEEMELPIERIVALRTARREQLVRERSDADAQLGEATREEMLCRQAVEHHAANRARDEADRERAERDCHSALAAAGFDSPDEARAARLDEAEQRDLRQSIAAAEEELRALAVRLEALESAIAGHEMTQETRSALAATADETARALEGAIGACAAARNDLERVRERNVEFHRISGQNAGALEREQTIEQLGRYLQGDAFINFLADERLTEVCRRATRMLEELTGGRYEILSRPDEGFLVRDMGNGGVERAPGSLSGGETFVVSLALALALSDTIQLGRSPLEFFFLDEGFGTLDAELLDTVVDTLERLRSRRRTIGLITHVTTLRERVPRRLVVSPPCENAGTVVRYEIA